MSFLSNIFKKKPGGTFFGNLLRAGASTVTGGMLGAGNNRIELGQTKTNAQLAKEGTFAGAPALIHPDGTIEKTEPLKEVSITAVKQSDVIPAWVQNLGDKISYLGERATEKTSVGVSDKTLMVLGGLGLLAIGVIAMNNNSR